MTDGVYAVPLERERFLVYAPLRRAAFVANAAMVDALAQLLSDGSNDHVEPSVREVAANCALLDSDDSNLTPITRLSLPLGSGHLSDGLTVESGRRAIDTVLRERVLPPDAPLSITYYGSPKSLLAIGQSLHAYAIHATGARGIPFRSRWIGQGPTSATEGRWVVDNLTAVTLTDLPIRNDPDSSPQWPDSTWSETLYLMDRARFPYTLRLELPSDAFAYLEHMVRRLCTVHKPAVIELRAEFHDAGEAAPTRHALAFLNAYKTAQRIARNLECVLMIPGTDLEERQDFQGFDPDEQIVRVDGSIASPAGTSPEYCGGCFARTHCAGPAVEELLAMAAPWNGSERCHVIREVIKGNILRRIADAGGLVWADAATVGVP